MHENTGLGFFLQACFQENRAPASRVARTNRQGMEQLAADPFRPQLETHKLKGELAGLWAYTVEYDCRLVFEFVKHPTSAEEEILLIDIGTHDQVY